MENGEGEDDFNCLAKKDKRNITYQAISNEQQHMS